MADAMYDDEVARVRRHITLGLKHIARQHELIAHLASVGADTTLSEQVLVNFEDSLLLHRHHLRRLQPDDSA
ncbi:hypothetical protein E2493_16735 [Sphingomonas parva]|uniref:Uncharacterized protein n=1 Tax=Sphingomonas parva TaxID=2555898 RepID=A0A4Y8ZNQ0_9SPHN|nr:hypothetical protein [Sphingomonas parva]TFI57077.1 hypothetical protein E2493_16735 [Sphingomonas parva]